MTLSGTLTGRLQSRLGLGRFWLPKGASLPSLPAKGGMQGSCHVCHALKNLPLGFLLLHGEVNRLGPSLRCLLGLADIGLEDLERMPRP